MGQIRGAGGAWGSPAPASEISQYPRRPEGGKTLRVGFGNSELGTPLAPRLCSVSQARGSEGVIIGLPWGPGVPWIGFVPPFDKGSRGHRCVKTPTLPVYRQVKPRVNERRVEVSGYRDTKIKLKFCSRFTKILASPPRGWDKGVSWRM